MKRALNFRGIMKSVPGRWCNGPGVFRIGERVFIVMDDAYLSWWEPGEEELNGFVEVDPATVGQWTGVIDAEGRCVYETIHDAPAETDGEKCA